MASDASPPNGAAPGPPGSTITLSWTGAGSTGLSVRVGPAVTLEQLYLAAFFLDVLAHEARQGDLTRAAMAGLVGAPSDILDQLRRSGRV